jgi:hypothetical protein
LAVKLAGLITHFIDERVEVLDYMKRIMELLENNQNTPSFEQPPTLAQNTFAAVSTAIFLDKLEEPEQPNDAVVDAVFHPEEIGKNETDKPVSTSKKRGRPKKTKDEPSLPANHKVVLDWLLKQGYIEKILDKTWSSNDVFEALPQDVSSSRSTVNRVISKLRKGDYNRYLGLQ